MDKYSGASDSQLQEFCRYLNNRRTIKGYNNWWSAFVLPFVVTVFATMILIYFGDLLQIKIPNNVDEILVIFSQMKFVDVLNCLISLALNL